MIRAASLPDAAVAGELAQLLWPTHDVSALEAEMAQLIARPDARVFLADENGTAVGFAQCQLRHDYVEGTHTSPVGYLEGLFVKPDARQNGVAQALVAACEQWAKNQGCREFASDCDLDNEVSLAVHLKIGFAEVNRIICFKKNL